MFTVWLDQVRWGYSRSRTRLIISCQVPQHHCSGLATDHCPLTWLSQLRYGYHCVDHKLTLSQCLNIFLAMRVIASDLYHSCGVVTMASTVFLCLISKSISHQKSTTGTSSEVCTRLITLSATHVKLYNPDRKSTRLNSSHLVISYAVFCLKKKKKKKKQQDKKKKKTRTIQKAYANIK